MNKYDERYEFRLAKLDEADIIMDWIDKNWKHNHIMAKDKNLFLYEYQENDRINMMLAIDKKKQTIEGLYGILKYSYGDENYLDITGGFYKVIPNDNIPMLGIELMKRVFEMTQFRYFSAIGINPRTALPLYKNIFKFSCIKLNHYYFLNMNKKEYNIAIINKKIDRIYQINNNIEARYCKTVEEIENNILFDKAVVPYKDLKYICKRFINYPYYDYKLLLIKDNMDSNCCLIVFRVIKVNDINIVRIVDFYGKQEVFSKSEKIMNNILNEFDAEYIDFYNYGFSDYYLQNAGFVKKEENDENIIPNYFEPFVQENADIYGSYNSPNVLFCKADGDQDRPNIMK